MPTILENVKNRILRKHEDERSAKVCSVRGVILQQAYEELGLKVSHPIDEEQAVEVMEGADQAVDIRRTVDHVKQRIEQSKKAAHLDKLKAAAEAAETELTEFNRQESERRRLALEKHEALNTAAVVTLNAYQQAEMARQNLITTAETTAEEQSLAAQLTELSHAIDRCKAALDRSGNPSISVVVLANNRRDQLRSKVTPQREAELKRELAHFENAARERTGELAELIKQHEALHAKLAKLALEKLKPENFAIIRRNRNQPVSA